MRSAIEKTTTRSDRYIAVWINADGTVSREACDDCIARLPAMAPPAAMEFVEALVRIPVRIDYLYEARTWEYPGCNETDVTLDRAEATVIDVQPIDGGPAVRSCLMPDVAEQILAAVLAAEE